MRAILAIVVVAAAGAYFYFEQQKKAAAAEPVAIASPVEEKRSSLSETVNKCTDGRGNITFSSEPCESGNNAEQVTVTSAITDNSELRASRYYTGDNKPSSMPGKTPNSDKEPPTRHASPARAIEAAHNADGSALY